MIDFFDREVKLVFVPLRAAVILAVPQSVSTHVVLFEGSTLSSFGAVWARQCDDDFVGSTLVLREIETLAAQEAKVCGVALSYAEAVQDSRLGLVLEWSAAGQSNELKARLDKYTFRHERVGNSAQ